MTLSYKRIGVESGTTITYAVNDSSVEIITSRNFAFKISVSEYESLAEAVAEMGEIK